MKSVSALLSDLILVNNEDFISELKRINSYTIKTLQDNLIRLNYCIEEHLNNIKKHNMEISEIKGLIEKYGITIQELHLIESEMFDVTNEKKNVNDIYSKIILNKLNTITNLS